MFEFGFEFEFELDFELDFELKFESDFELKLRTPQSISFPFRGVKISTHSTSWQFQTIKLIQKPIKSLYNCI